LPSFSQTLTLKEAFENITGLNEEVNSTEFDGAFCKKLLFYFFAKRRKSVEKMNHRKKNRGHRASKIVKSTPTYSNGHLPLLLFYYLARALDAWRVNFVRSKDAQKQKRS